MCNMELKCLCTAKEDLKVKYFVHSLGENLCHQYFSQGVNIHYSQIIAKVSPSQELLVTNVLMNRQFSEETQMAN